MEAQQPAARRRRRPRNPKLPPDTAGDVAEAQLKSSPRHGEWVDIKAVPAATPNQVASSSIRSAATRRRSCIVIHEIFGLSDWVRGVADQLAKEGFIAVAPDLLSGMGPNGGGTEELGDRARRRRSAR